MRINIRRPYADRHKSHIIFPIFINLNLCDIINYDFKHFPADYMERVFINTKDNYAIRFEEPISNRMYIAAGSNRIPNVHISKHVMDYGISYYYFFFGEDELIEAKTLLNPVVSNVKTISTNIIEHMFKRLNALQKQEENNLWFCSRFKNDGWVCKEFSSEKEIDIKNLIIHDYKSFYDNYYSYCKTLIETKNTSIAKWLSIIAIIISIIGTVVSIVIGCLS